MTNQEMIDVIQAYMEGKTIEESECGCSVWCDIDITSDTFYFDFEAFNYRIKEEPKELTPYERAVEKYGYKFEVVNVYLDATGYWRILARGEETLEMAVSSGDFAGYVYDNGHERALRVSVQPAELSCTEELLRPIAVLLSK